MKDTAFILSGAQLVTHNHEFDLSTGKSAGGLRTIADPSDVITGSTLISVVGGPARLEAHSLVTGTLLWKSQPFAETTTSAVWSAAVGDGEVLVATDARTMALSLRSGRLDWSNKHGGVNPDPQTLREAVDHENSLWTCSEWSLTEAPNGVERSDGDDRVWAVCGCGLPSGSYANPDEAQRTLDEHLDGIAAAAEAWMEGWKTRRPQPTGGSAQHSSGSA